MNSYFSAAKRGDVDTIARKLADPSLDLNAQDAVREPQLKCGCFLR
jgi:hypothetical protein